MQYWIFFIGGVGGDGFSNLLEQANNITPSDGVIGFRDEITKSGKIRFRSPQYAESSDFLKKWEFDNSCILVTSYYMNLIEMRINTVIPTHPAIYGRDIETIIDKEILEKDRFNIYLYSDDKTRVFEDYVDKIRPNGMNDDEKRIAISMRQRTSKSYLPSAISNPPLSFYDCLIDIEKAWRDWNYLDTILKKIGIDLSEDVYREYLRIAQRP